MAVDELVGASPGDDLKSLSLEDLFAKLREGFEEQGKPEALEIVAKLEHRIRQIEQQTSRVLAETRQLDVEIRFYRYVAGLLGRDELRWRHSRTATRRRSVRRSRMVGARGDPSEPSPSHLAAAGRGPA